MAFEVLDKDFWFCCLGMYIQWLGIATNHNPHFPHSPQWQPKAQQPSHTWCKHFLEYELKQRDFWDSLSPRLASSRGHSMFLCLYVGERV